jgi:hypothetical protein
MCLFPKAEIFWEMRPSGETLVASWIINPAPPQHDYPNVLNANHLKPSTAEYWHMGEIAIRFFKRKAFMSKEENIIMMT